MQAKEFAGEQALAKLGSWLRVIVHNVAVEVLRGLRRHSAASLVELASEPLDEGEVNRVERAAGAEWVTACLERLRQETPENCWLVCQHYLEGRTVQELAEETGTAVHNFIQTIQRVLV